ncbi:ClpP/crotonase-like domain-containing protein [Pisolithus croceorrhizus]|nr:ClpP/crotonase-like domain-containing protein [Pisolithus croceorrhizus]
MGQSKITVEVSQGVATITLNEPQRLNALSPEDYDDFSNSLREIDQRDDVVVTIWQANGSWFCAGTNVKGGVSESQPIGSTLRDQLRTRVISANTDCTQALYTHSKLLVAALNGPVMAFLGNFDFIYAVPEAWLYMGLPFVGRLTFFWLCLSDSLGPLGLAVEGGASVNFVNRMGLAKAKEVLIFNKKMTAQELLEGGFVNKIFPSKSTEAFHAAVRRHLHSELEGLDLTSVLTVKYLIKAGLAEKNNPDALNLRESYVQAERFRSGVPSVRFGMLARKEIRHKL